jgi:hypothetical protein
MAVYTINEETLTAIADAIREKTGKTDSIITNNMPAEIRGIESSGGDLTADDLMFSGSMSYAFAGTGWNGIINKFSHLITVKDATYLSEMFLDNTTITNIPFDINCVKSTTSYNATSMFEGCNNLTNVPNIIGFKPKSLKSFFYNCCYLREIPSTFCETWDWSGLDGPLASYDGDRSKTFANCYSLRSYPNSFLIHHNKNASSGYGIYNYLFNCCYVLDEVVDLPVCHLTSTNNLFSSSFSNCYRLKNMTFATNEDGTPIVVQWKSQTIDLSSSTGFGTSAKYILNYNSGITTDKLITDATSYQALKNDPDWYCLSLDCARYNHDSAVATINSLPDASAYLATAGGTNTIKFKGAAGSATDGGAISTLTEEEIAVAAAKGWTVSLV